jgi:hypothetical protein
VIPGTYTYNAAGWAEYLPTSSTWTIRGTNLTFVVWDATCTTIIHSAAFAGPGCYSTGTNAIVNINFTSPVPGTFTITDPDTCP